MVILTVPVVSVHSVDNNEQPDTKYGSNITQALENSLEEGRRQYERLLSIIGSTSREENTLFFVSVSTSFFTCNRLGIKLLQLEPLEVVQY